MRRRCPVRRFQCAHFHRGSGLRFDLRDGSRCSKRGCRELLDMGLGLHHRQRCFVRFPRVLGGRCCRLLALLMATTAPAAAAAASFTLFARLTDRRLCLRGGRTGSALDGRALPLRRLLTRLLWSILAASVLLAPLLEALLVAAAVA